MDADSDGSNNEESTSPETVIDAAKEEEPGIPVRRKSSTKRRTG